MLQQVRLYAKTHIVHDPAMVSDDDLICAAGKGDEAAFASLTRRHAARAHTLAFRQVGRMSDAEDIVQEAFWRTWKQASHWRPGEAAYTTWLHKVIVNLCIDRERRMKWRRWLPFSDVVEPVSDDASPYHNVESRAELAAVMLDMQALPPRQRAALLLSAEGELSNRDIAQVLGVSEKALESLLVRGRRALRLKAAARNEDTLRQEKAYG
jgi:RNA polymerase sigma-70 factor, ECF subfamily